MVMCAALFAAIASGDGGPIAPPSSELNMVLEAPIRTWDEGIPLGNGLLGGLLWGEGGTLRLSLDRGDLWDERPAADADWWKTRNWAAGRKLVEAGEHGKLSQWWDGPYDGVSPTKLPGGRLEIDLAPGSVTERFELRLAPAEGVAHLRGGGAVRVFYSAAEPVALVRLPGHASALRLLSPGQVLRRSRGADAGPSSGGSVDRLGYPDAVAGAANGAQWYVQEAAQGLRYCVCVDSRAMGEETLAAVTITSTADGPDPLSLGRRRCARALERGWDRMAEPHLAWWRRFWSRSSISIPAPAVARYATLCRYFYGAASRRGAPPMPLQGVWTADTGGLPPWKGDYHNDLNTQMTYIAYQAAGHFDEGAAYLDLLWKLAPRFREFARGFYGAPGLATPGVMSLAGQPLGGWGQYSLSPTMTSWNAHLFYLHWRTTGDDGFLRTRAYPWCREAGECLRALLSPGPDGVLRLPLSSSPEIFGNSGQAWLKPNSNYDLMCMKMQFLALVEMADAMGAPAESSRWREAAAGLGDFHVDRSGLLLIDAHQALPESHRHLSNLMALFPFNLITVEGGDDARRRIDATLADWKRHGTSAWCGYSFAWMSALEARVGRAEDAARDLEIFIKAFILRNGFHVNGDQTASGYSAFTYRPFTLEGNFAALRALQEMLLQSWSPTPGLRDTEVLRIFPATPSRWATAAFSDLRAEGGHRVSARREGGVTTWLRVVAGRTGVVRIRADFGGREPVWTRRDVRRFGGGYEVQLGKGRAVEATLQR